MIHLGVGVKLSKYFLTFKGWKFFLFLMVWKAHLEGQNFIFIFHIWGVGGWVRLKCGKFHIYFFLFFFEYFPKEDLVSPCIVWNVKLLNAIFVILELLSSMYFFKIFHATLCNIRLNTGWIQIRFWYFITQSSTVQTASLDSFSLIKRNLWKRSIPK